jgi:hypothetical protein
VSVWRELVELSCKAGFGTLVIQGRLEKKVWLCCSFFID